jgi:hypothetical protein
MAHRVFAPHCSIPWRLEQTGHKRWTIVSLKSSAALPSARSCSRLPLPQITTKITSRAIRIMTPISKAGVITLASLSLFVRH